MLSEEFREVITCRKNKSEKVRGIPIEIKPLARRYNNCELRQRRYLTSESRPITSSHPAVLTYPLGLKCAITIATQTQPPPRPRTIDNYVPRKYVNRIGIKCASPLIGRGEAFLRAGPRRRRARGGDIWTGPVTGSKFRQGP